MPTPAAPLSGIEDTMRIITDNVQKYFKGASDLTLRNHKILRLLFQYGRVMFNCPNHAYVWNVKVRKPPVRQKISGQKVVYTSNTTDEQLHIDIRGYEGTDVMEEKEYIVNQSPEKIVDRYTRITADLKQSFDEHIAEFFYVDGNDAAYSSHYHGIGTIFGKTGDAVLATDRVAVPGGAYAGQNTGLAHFGGSWETGSETYNAALGNSWPFGKGSSEYDATSPILANWASTAWEPSGTANFEDNIELVIGFLTTAMATRTGYQNLTGAPLIMMLDPSLFNAAKNHFRDRNRQLVPVGANNDLGIPGEALNIDGMYVCPDYAVGNNNSGVVLVPQYMEMVNAHPDLYKFRGPEFAMTDASYLLYASAYGNFRFQPKYFAKIADYTD